MGCLPHLAFESESIDYATMQALGYDATTFGNHEFDFGPAALARSIQTAQARGGLPPIVASNIHFSASDPNDDALASLYGEGQDKPVRPYRVITTPSGIRVGVLGFVGINAAHVAPNKTPVAFSAPVDPKTDGDVAANLPRLYADVQPVVDRLRSVEKVDFVVALSHSGVRDTSSAAGIAQGEDTQVCQNVAGIDLIVSGHTHNHDPKPMHVTNAQTQKPCLVLNGGAFGKEVGRVDFAIAPQGVSWVQATQALVPVDDTTVPDPALAEQVNTMVGRVEGAGSGGSTLASLLSHALGTPVTDDATAAGDLYFKPLATTDFDVKDTNALVWLSADAMLAQTDALAGDGVPATNVAVETAGVIRAVVAKGKSGVVSAADAFNVVPLGRSPVAGTMGYPLVRGNISRIELRAVFELALALGLADSDYNLGAAAIKVEYDRTRPVVASPADLLDPAKGRVMRMTLDSNHAALANALEQYDQVIYDRAHPVGGDTSLVSLVTSSYVAQFAADAGVVLKDASGHPLALVDAIVKRADSSEVKQVEAFMRYLHASPQGKVPTLYDTTSPAITRRWSCVNGCGP
jgi:5'-nucleotidase